MKQLCLLIICSFALAGCSKPAGNNNNTSNINSSGSDSALSMLHARPDPSLLSQVHSQSQQAANVTSTTNGNASGIILANLPTVSQAPFAPPADQVVHADLQQLHPDTSSNNSIWPFSNAAKSTDNHSDDQSAQVASYAPYNRSPSHSGSLVPPPPAIVLSTQAQPVSFSPPVDVYGNPYTGNPNAGVPTRSPGSLFGIGSAHANNDSSSEERRHIDFVPITPSGMDARSAYKQRDDLKLLWKGALGSSGLQSLAQRDAKIAQELNAVVVGLPSESSRGSLNVSQRQIDLIFKAPALDRRIFPEVKKLELDLTQAYYRYLYAFNKYALAQQTVAARKQELDYADDAAEKQRATTDWSAAKNDADAATDDMKSAQYELASAVGPQAARVIIGRISGVTPSADSLAQGMDSGSSASQIASRHRLLGSLFHHDESSVENTAPAPSASKTSAAKSQTTKSKLSTPGKGKMDKADSKADKIAKRDKDKHAPAIHGPAIAKDLAPAPDSSNADRNATDKVDPVSNNSVPVSYSSSGSISFVLKGVSVTPRKSIIKVAVRNNGSDNFTFDPDTVGVREGMNQLPDAMVRADFDTTKVAPNQEVCGIITIFGRPWNDRLTVSLADGSRTIQMRR
jgi:hypothetical protein